MPEWAWGLVAIITGAVTCYGVLRPSYRSLTMGSAVVAWYWTLIAFMYFWGDWESTGGISALTFATYSAFIYLNIKVNKRAMGLSETEANMRLKAKNY